MIVGSTLFKTNPVPLRELLRRGSEGDLQLPDFQRSWVWGIEDIRGLLASVSRAFPIGALMTLETGGEVAFRPRPFEGAVKEAATVTPQALVLDGQQRVTSLLQALFRDQPVEVTTPSGGRSTRWFHLDIEKCLDPAADRESAVLDVPADRRLRSRAGRRVVADLTTPEFEFEHMIFPLAKVFRFHEWMVDFVRDAMRREDADRRIEMINRFQAEVIDAIIGYQVPVITLDRSTSREAVCVVFEKVNTGGKPLDAFELVTASFAAHGHHLRGDWYGTGNGPGLHRRLTSARAVGARRGVLAEVTNTDFLQVVSVLHRAIEGGARVAASLASRRALLDLPLDAYLRFRDRAERGFLDAAEMLHGLRLYRARDLPSQAQVTALAAVLAVGGVDVTDEGHRAMLRRWFWCGALGELYVAGTDARITADVREVPAWIAGGAEPTTVTESVFAPARILPGVPGGMPAHRAITALLCESGARDVVTGESLDQDLVVTGAVAPMRLFTGVDDFVAMAPMTAASAKVLSGATPSEWIESLENGVHGEPVSPEEIDFRVRSLLADPALLRADRLEEFADDRHDRLLGLVEDATGRPVSAASRAGEADDWGEGGPDPVDPWAAFDPVDEHDENAVGVPGAGALVRRWS